jgi:5-methylcytosine-specific restriction endonuclease McrA
MNEPLKYKSIGKRKPHYERVMFFDPTELYKRIKIDKHKRKQSISMENLFPPNDQNRCRCGCDKELSGRRTSWASTDCSRFATDIQAIISGQSKVIKNYLIIYHNWQCIACNVMTDIEIDHITGVKHGGGGCWLSNYQLLCNTHHRAKTNKDFGYRKTVKKRVKK